MRREITRPFHVRFVGIFFFFLLFDENVAQTPFFGTRATCVHVYYNYDEMTQSEPFEICDDARVAKRISTCITHVFTLSKVKTASYICIINFTENNISRDHFYF